MEDYGALARMAFLLQDAKGSVSSLCINVILSKRTALEGESEVY